MAGPVKNLNMAGPVKNPSIQMSNQSVNQPGNVGTVGFPTPKAQRVQSSAANDGQVNQAVSLNLIDISGLHVSAARLLKQLLASMVGKEMGRDEVQASETGKAEEKESARLPKKKIELVETSAQGKARASKGIIKPYRHRCLSKGHAKEECVVVLTCDICSSQSHLKPRCSLQKKATKIFAMTCGYVVDGLGFYYIPHKASSRPKSDHNAVMIRVLEGTLSGEQVAMEMDRLVLGPSKWVVQEMDRNTFKANFQSRMELNRMVEWGGVQTKDKMAKMIIEESNGGSHYKQALRRVWVQMMGLPGELREYLTIWVVGTILGVMKDIDIKFTREYERARFQVLVLKPSLIPQSVNMVIGEFIYELHFCVEQDEMAQPVPIDI
jgi:hypothetical protein